jgi:hypothetical protein
VIFYLTAEILLLSCGFDTSHSEKIIPKDQVQKGFQEACPECFQNKSFGGALKGVNVILKCIGVKICNVKSGGKSAQKNMYHCHPLESECQVTGCNQL